MGNRLYWFILLFGFSLSAQVKGVVVDQLGRPISYVTIWVENENISTTAEENGEFTLNVTSDKNLIFSSLGYEKQIIKASQAQKVTLNELAFKLDEVVISKRFETRELEIGKVKNETFQAFENAPRIDAKYFPYFPKYKKTRYIKQVTVYTDSQIENATLKIHFYAVNLDGSPGDEMLNKDFIVTVRKGVLKHKFNVTDFNLKMPKNGIFVGFEKLIIDRNKIERLINDSNSGSTSTQKIYYPYVLYNFVEKEFAYLFSGGKWIKQNKENVVTTSDKIKVYEPAIDLILTN